MSAGFLVIGPTDSTQIYAVFVYSHILKEYAVSYEQYFTVEAESAQEAVDFVYENITRATIENTEKLSYPTESSFIGFDAETGNEYYRDDILG